MVMPVYIFLGILGFVAGCAVIWLVSSYHPFETLEEPYLPPDPLEAGFLAREMTERGRPMDEETVAELLRLHLDYVEGLVRENQAREREARLEARRREIASAAEAKAPTSEDEA